MALTIKSSILQGEAQPYVLPSTPWVLSVGKRVMGVGYSFVWLAKSNPYLLSLSGTRIELKVHGHTPYLQVGHPSRRAMAAILTLPRPVYPSRFKSAAARTADEEDDSDTSDEEEDQWTLVKGGNKSPRSILKSSPAPTSGAKYFVPSSKTSSDDRRAGNSSDESEDDQIPEEQNDSE